MAAVSCVSSVESVPFVLSKEQFGSILKESIISQGELIAKKVDIAKQCFKSTQLDEFQKEQISKLLDELTRKQNKLISDVLNLFNRLFDLIDIRNKQLLNRLNPISEQQRVENIAFINEKLIECLPYLIVFNEYKLLKDNPEMISKESFKNWLSRKMIETNYNLNDESLLLATSRDYLRLAYVIEHK